MQVIAIIIDWDNIKKRIFDKDGFPKEFSYKNWDLTNFILFFRSFLEESEALFRIYFYTAKPYDGDISRHFSKLPQEIQNNEELKEEIIKEVKTKAEKLRKFQKNLSKQNFIALRLGSLSFDGWITSSKGKPKPNFKQKKVDMLMGLDIAHLSYKRLVDRILVFSYDTDIQPALKVARMEGIQIILPVLIDDTFPNPPYELIKHSDILRKRRISDIINKIQ